VRDAEFEWEDAKAAANAAKHGVTLQEARPVFADQLAFEFEDTRADCGKDRCIRVGMVGTRLLVVAGAYTERGRRFRIISAMPAPRTLQRLGQEGNCFMKKKSPRTLRLAHVAPLTKAESEALARRVAAARARNRGPTCDQDIPESLPEGAVIIQGPARRGRPRQTAEGSKPVTLRVPRKVLSFFKRGGRGWQTRAVAAMTRVMEESE